MFPKLDLKLNRPISIGKTAALLIGLGVPGLLAIYYVITHNKNDEQANSDDQGRMSRTRIITLEVRVPNDCVKHIIGPQGSVIKELQSKTNTRISFKDKPSSSSNSNLSSSAEALTTTGTGADDTARESSIMLVRGSPWCVQRAELEIKRLVLDAPINLTYEFLVPEFACGRIIGRGGKSIREISTVSNCKVTIERKSPSDTQLSNARRDLILDMSWNDDYESTTTTTNSSNMPKYKLLTLVGSFEQIESAKELILEKIKEEEEIRAKRKGVSNYSKFKVEPSIIAANERKAEWLAINAEIRKIDKRPSREAAEATIVNTKVSEVTKSSEEEATAPQSSQVVSTTSTVEPIFNQDVMIEEPESWSSSSSSSCVSKKLTTNLKIARLDLRSHLDEKNRVDVSVSAYSGSLSFWVQMKANAGTLSKFIDDLSHFYNSNVSSFFDFFNKDDLNLNDMVAVKISSHTWHRAEVRSIQVSLDGHVRPELIDVYYVDAGISDYVKFRNIRRLAAQFYELPIQAIECCLCDIEPAAPDQDEAAVKCFWSDEALQFFENFIFDKSDYVLEHVDDGGCNESRELSRNDDKPLVRLYEKLPDRLISVSDLMIERGYAKRKISTTQVSTDLPILLAQDVLKEDNHQTDENSSSSCSETLELCND